MSEPDFKPILFGGGRLARHLSRYLSALGIDFIEHFNSRSLSGLEKSSQSATHLWMLVPDDALPGLALALNDRFPAMPLIHSCASKGIPHAITLHPLMTFGRVHYTKEEYQRIPLTLFHEELSESPGSESLFRNAFPNPIHILKTDERIRYHLNCVMISNLSVLLWSAAMKAGPGLDREIFAPILNQTLNNFLTEGEESLTGPLARRDTKTIELHLQTLEGSPEYGLYLAFKEYYHAHRT